MATLLELIYKTLISQRQKVILVFKGIYLLLVLFTIIVIFFFRKGENTLITLFTLGNKVGEASLIAYLLTLLPGMGARFGIKNNILSLLRIYRRYIGISMYLLSLVHIVLVKAIFASTVAELLPEGTFEIMGSFSLILLFFLFITSNDISVRFLRGRWYDIQRITNIAMFFILLHISLVKISFWTVLTGIFVIAQIMSFITNYQRKQNITI